MKERLDVLVVQRGLAPSREKAKALIMAGVVLVNDEREDKAGSMFPPDVEIRIKGTPQKYVSRGGYKLEKALEVWPIRLEDRVCMDVGASTGGFTDCMLQNGARKVYAVDVGTNQLAWKLRQDPRVVCMEQTNVRYLQPEQIPEAVTFVSIDVSFISLTKVLPAICAVMEEGAEMAALVKPQFEAGREKVGKKGVVRDAKVHEQVLREVVSFAEANGFAVLGLSFSPIRGPEGNIEYLMYLRKEESAEAKEGAWEETIRALVAQSHAAL